MTDLNTIPHRDDTAAAVPIVNEGDVDAPILAAALARRTRPWKPILSFLLIGLGVTAVVVAGNVPKRERAEQLARTAAKLEAIRKRVQLGTIRSAPPVRTLALPASLEPMSQVVLYPQATGYVRERCADIGDQVRKGDVLARIDVPLITEELAAAEAAVRAAEASRDQSASQLELAEASLRRAVAAADENATSAQELDERAASARTLRAGRDAAEATVRLRAAEAERLRQQIVFASVTAPFDGTITDRTIQVGDYLEPASGNAGRAMFRLADLSSLRVFVDVPQAYASSIQAGHAATVSLPGRAGQEVRGTVARTSIALDQRTRTLRVEIVVPNSDQALLGNAYGQVKLEVKEALGTLLVPSSAVLVRASGAKVAIVDAENRLRYAAVTLGRDLGAEVEILEGLRGDERIATNLADEFADGAEVDPVAAVQPPRAAAP